MAVYGSLHPFWMVSEKRKNGKKLDSIYTLHNLPAPHALPPLNVKVPLLIIPYQAVLNNSLHPLTPGIIKSFTSL